MTIRPDTRAMAFVLMMTCAVGGGFASGMTRGARAQAPEQVLTDTADYCAELQLQADQAMAHAATKPGPDIVTLLDDGQLMCKHGEIKGGIIRLRRALMALRRGS